MGCLHYSSDSQAVLLFTFCLCVCVCDTLNRIKKDAEIRRYQDNAET